MSKLSDFNQKFSDLVVARILKNVYQTFLFVSGGLVVLAIIATVVMRYVLKTDLFGIEEVILVLAFWFYFMGGVNGSMEDSQVRADVVNFIIKNETARYWIRLLARVIEIVALVFLCVMSFQLLQLNFQRMPTTQGLRIPYVIPQMAIFVGFLLMLIYSVGHILVAFSKKPISGTDAE